MNKHKTLRNGVFWTDREIDCEFNHCLHLFLDGYRRVLSLLVHTYQ